jgi:hypothetical protein
MTRPIDGYERARIDTSAFGDNAAPIEPRPTLLQALVWTIWSVGSDERLLTNLIMRAQPKG